MSREHGARGIAPGGSPAPDNVLYDADCPHCWHGYPHTLERHRRELVLAQEAGDGFAAYWHGRILETVRSYKIQRGDTPYRVAKLFVNDGARWTEIPDAEPWTVGRVITIPESWRKDDPG